MALRAPSALRRMAAGVAATILLAAAGCGPDKSVTMIEGDPLVFVAYTDAWQNIGHGGTVSYDQQTGCLYYGQADVTVPVWPRGTSPHVSADGLRGVTNPDFGDIVEGDTVQLRGLRSSPEDPAADVQQVYDACDLREGRDHFIRIAEVRGVD